MTSEEKLRARLYKAEEALQDARKALRQLRPYAELVDDTRARASMTSIIVNALEES